MATLRSLIYISDGNLPSKMANTIQIAKMGQALAQKLANFELVTGGHIGSTLKGMDAEFQTWYGLHNKLKLVRLPTHIKVNYPFPPDYQCQTFFKLAVLYACLKSPSLAYTRDSRTAEFLLSVGGIPVLYEQHHHITKESPYCSLLTNKNLTGFITTSSQLAENYIEQGLDPSKILIAPNAVDPKNFLPYQEKGSARQKLSLQQNEKIILYSGHLYKYKGIPTLLETAGLMPECTFILVGGWENDIKTVKETCKNANLHNVYVIGHVPQSELASYLYAADILMLPTSKYWEEAESTNPLKLFDYMAVRRPIVASALPNIMTILRDGENGLLAEPDDPISFKSAMEKLFIAPALADSIAECAFQEVQNFTWDNRAENVLTFATEKLQQVDESTNNPRENLLRYAQESYKRLSKKMTLKNSL